MKILFIKSCCFLCFALIILLACSINREQKIINRIGNESLKFSDKSFIGISTENKDEQQARMNALENALMQISMFNGLEISSIIKSDITSITDKAGETYQDAFQQKTSIITKTFFNTFAVKYYTEKFKRDGDIYYKCWCYIPYDEKIKHKFLNN